MSPAIPEPGAPASPRVALSSRRCARHSEREAAARCPGCGGFFCRECVAEYKGRLLCAGCLRTAAAAPGTASGRWRALARTAALAGAFLLAWSAFLGLGVVALRIPDSVHNGTFWERLGARLE